MLVMECTTIFLASQRIKPYCALRHLLSINVKLWSHVVWIPRRKSCFPEAEEAADFGNFGQQ